MGCAFEGDAAGSGEQGVEGGRSCGSVLFLRKQGSMASVEGLSEAQQQRHVDVQVGGLGGKEGVGGCRGTERAGHRGYLCVCVSCCYSCRSKAAIACFEGLNEQGIEGICVCVSCCYSCRSKAAIASFEGLSEAQQQRHLDVEVGRGRRVCEGAEEGAMRC